MKIEKVSFDNINSLGGHFELDLQHSSLTDAGIFVITGPTGVGKTTLLDAMCYAIYGCTARQSRLSARSNEIMTHGARFCRAEAWVEKEGVRYLFTCEQRRKKTRAAGAEPYTTPRRSVSRLEADGRVTLLADKVREVEALAEGMMKFSNFTRCMMLAQGEFARFLRDDAAGRSEALATITGTEIYQRIGETVQGHVAALRAQMQQVALPEVLGEEQRAALDAQLQQAESLCAQHKEALSALEGRLRQRAELARAEELCAACERACRAAEQELHVFVESGRLQGIRRAEAALQLRPLMQAAEQAAEALRQSTQQEQRERDLLAAHGGSAEKAAAEQSEAALAAEEPRLNARLSFLAEQVRPQEERVAEGGIRLQAATQQAATRCTEWQQAAQAVSRAEAAESAARREQEAAEAERRQREGDAPLAESLPAIRERLSDWAACPQVAAELPDDAALADLGAAWQQEHDRLLAGCRREELPIQLARLEYLQAACVRRNEAQARRAEAERAHAAASAALAGLPSVSEAQRDLQAAHARVELALKIQDAGQKLEELYREFCAGHLPCCPCCGSPEPHERPVQPHGALAEARAQEQEAQRELAWRQQRQEEASRALAAAQSTREAAARNLEEAAQNCAQALAAPGWERVPDELAAQVEQLRSAMAGLAALDARRAELDGLEQLAACRAALHAALPTAWAEKPADLAAARALVARLEARWKDWQQAQEKAQKAAQALHLAVELKAQAMEVLAEAQRRHEAAQQARANAQAADAQEREALAQLWQGGPAREAEKAARQQLEDLQKAAADARRLWQQLLREQESHRALLRAAEEQLPGLKAKQEQSAREWAEGCRQHGFADAEDCAAARLSPEDLQELRRQWNDCTKAQHTAEGALRQAAERQAELRAQLTGEESAEELEEQQAACKAALAAQEERAAHLRAEELADEHARRANAEKEAQLADTRCELDRWQRLYEILGNSREGFKKYAQRITFNLLLVQANAQMRRLSDRYVLVQDTEEELGLLVLDRYQDNTRGRSCSNLSGGESFIVSLALALGLSRMAGETRIDTLFLDEGFGTLDEQALENVLDCLQSLREGGKLIGIISHVEALKERIPANIELVPLGASGLSTMAPHAAVVAQPGLG